MSHQKPEPDRLNWGVIFVILLAAIFAAGCLWYAFANVFGGEKVNF